MSSFSERLAEAVRRRGNPVVVGLDPRVENLPAGIMAAEDTICAESVAEALAEFCRGVIDVVASLVPAVKPQAAFFEQWGPAGMSVLADVIQYARSKDLLVILDGKRNDIGTTAAAYAQAYLGRFPKSIWGADALTVSPYLGDDSLSPFVDAVNANEAGIFVLVKTSNPGGGLFQDLVADGRPVFEHVASHVEQLAAANAGDDGYGSVGAVVGATYPDQLAKLRATMPHCWFLVPGFGAQGGAAKDVGGAFDKNGLGAIINNSRGIIFAHEREPYRETYGPQRWQAAVEAATRDMIGQLQSETSVGKLTASVKG